VAPAGGRVIIAGGTIGTAATRDVLAFDPRTARVRRIGTLPKTVTHAAAATLGETVYVVGGRGPALGTQTDAVLAIDAATGRVTRAGRLPRRLSDIGVTAARDHLTVVGGRDPAGQVRNEALELRPSGGTG